MTSILRIVLAVFAAAAGLAALYLVGSPGSIANGRAWALGAITLLIACTLLSTVWDTLRSTASEPFISAELVSEAPADPVQGEVSKLLGLLRQHAEANETFSTALERAK